MIDLGFDLAECGCCSEKVVVEVEDPEDIDCAKSAIKTKKFYRKLQKEVIDKLGPMTHKKDIKEYLTNYLNCSSSLVQHFLDWLSKKGKKQGNHYVFSVKLN